MIGQKVGNYVITSLLGEGGMGTVYLATHPRMGRQVAVKFLHRGLLRHPQALTRFLVEARIANALRNPHIVEVFDFGEHDGQPYILMEWLQGRSLGEILAREGRLPVRRALHIGAQVATALHDAHEAGIVHRDIKPGNIFVAPRGEDPDFARLLDFGIAKLLRPLMGDAGHQTLQDAVVGTPTYMSPEQVSDPSSIDGRSDQYGLGVVLFEMLTGRPPFEGGGAPVMMAHVATPPPLPSNLCPDLPEAVAHLVLRALAKRPQDRFPHMAELARTLQAAGDGLPVTATEPAPGLTPGLSLQPTLLPDRAAPHPTSEVDLGSARRALVHLAPRSDWPQACGPNEVLLWPARQDETDALALAHLALDQGPWGFLHGPVLDAVTRYWLPSVPTLDDLLALYLLVQRDRGVALPADGLKALASYAVTARQGVVPGTVAPTRSLVGLFLALATDVDALPPREAARTLVHRGFALFDHALARMARGQNLLGDDIFGDEALFANELALLDADAATYEDDLSRASRWMGILEGHPVDLLVMRRPASALFKVWARRDARSPLGRGYRVLLVEMSPNAWICSVDPLRRLPFKAFAIRMAAFFSALETPRRKAEGLPDSPWYDGARLRYTLFASPISGTLLPAETVIRGVQEGLAAWMVQ